MRPQLVTSAVHATAAGSASVSTVILGDIANLVSNFFFFLSFLLFFFLQLYVISIGQEGREGGVRKGDVRSIVGYLGNIALWYDNYLLRLIFFSLFLSLPPLLFGFSESSSCKCTLGDPCCGPDCQPLPSSVVCRNATGDCDLADYCDGTNGRCPKGFYIDFFPPLHFFFFLFGFILKIFIIIATLTRCPQARQYSLQAQHWKMRYSRGTFVFFIGIKEIEWKGKYSNKKITKVANTEYFLIILQLCSGLASCPDDTSLTLDLCNVCGGDNTSCTAQGTFLLLFSFYFFYILHFTPPLLFSHILFFF